MTPRELLEIAKALAESRHRGGVSAVAMRRSVSTSYYAVFHALARLCADELIGDEASSDWERIYRALDHGQAKTDLLALAAETKEQALGRIAGTFGDLQLDRHAADYDPRKAFSALEADSWLLFAKEAVSELERLEAGLRRRLAVRLMLKMRRGRS